MDALEHPKAWLGRVGKHRKQRRNSRFGLPPPTTESIKAKEKPTETSSNSYAIAGG
jgi:hypothetical protein